MTPRSKDPDVKQITIIEGQNNSKAVIVDYKDPITGDLARANVPYDTRGLPIMDNVAASTQKIDYTKNYEGQMVQATKDLWNQIKNDKNQLSRFMPAQLQDIQDGAQTIKGFRWHHNAQSAPHNMQLIPLAVHNSVRHLGQKSVTQGK